MNPLEEPSDREFGSASLIVTTSVSHEKERSFRRSRDREMKPMSCLFS
jgi:hypothetical protein